jgi:hypothetical protein
MIVRSSRLQKKNHRQRYDTPNHWRPYSAGDRAPNLFFFSSRHGTKFVFRQCTKKIVLYKKTTMRVCIRIVIVFLPKSCFVLLQKSECTWLFTGRSVPLLSVRLLSVRLLSRDNLGRMANIIIILLILIKFARSVRFANVHMVCVFVLKDCNQDKGTIQQGNGIGQEIALIRHVASDFQQSRTGRGAP